MAKQLMDIVLPRLARPLYQHLEQFQLGRLDEDQFTRKFEKELQKHPIKELSEPATKERMMQSIERGNLHQVTFVKGDKEEKMFIEANPQFKTLNLYDSSLKKVFQENPKKDIKTEEQEGPQKKEAIKNPPSAEEPEPDSVRNKKTGKRKLSV